MHGRSHPPSFFLPRPVRPENSLHHLHHHRPSQYLPIPPGPLPPPSSPPNLRHSRPPAVSDLKSYRSLPSPHTLVRRELLQPHPNSCVTLRRAYLATLGKARQTNNKWVDAGATQLEGNRRGYRLELFHLPVSYVMTCLAPRSLFTKETQEAKEDIAYEASLRGSKI